MPPLVPPTSPRDITPSALQDQYMFDEGTLLQRRIHNRLCGNSLPAAPALIAGNDDAAFAVLDAIAEGFRGEASKDDGVDSADAGAGEEGGDGVPGHGEVDGNGVAAFDAP